MKLNFKFFHFSPITVKRLQRFRRSKVAFYSLWVLIGIYVLSLFAELIANSNPLIMRFNDKYYFPFLHSVPPEEILNAADEFAHVNYRKFTKSEAFTSNPDNFAIFAPIPYSPDDTVGIEDIEDEREVTISYIPTQPLARFNITQDGYIVRQDNCEQFFTEINLEDEVYQVSDIFVLDDATKNAIQDRVNHKHCSPYTTTLKIKDGIKGVRQLVFHLPETIQGHHAKTIRANIRTELDESKLYHQPYILTFEKDEEKGATTISHDGPTEPSPEMLAHATNLAVKNYSRSKSQQNLSTVDQTPSVEKWTCPHTGTVYSLSVRDDAHFPFHPTGRHIFGLDDAGRDVFSRILYATRISLTFGLVLASTATLLGIIIGAIQGFFGGKVDICMQRFTEIWAALPFLYIMALLGNLLGRSFGLLLLVYGCFCWIGLSYYMRAEFLRLRNRPFVAAARCLGLSNTRIIFFHILPNALTPVITLFPFLLVGAIGTLVSLDFLGFGLPPLTPSWGELLHQAQEHRSAWWLIVFPTATIFIVMFSTVMVGEGVRNAFDPKPFSKLQ